MQSRRPLSNVGPTPRGPLLQRIAREAGVPGLAEILSDRIPPSDLQSLLMEVYSRRSRSRDAQAVLRDYQTNRFVRPGHSSPQDLFAWDALLWMTLPADFEGIELSPVAPFGAVASLTPLSQDWSVTTSRNTEVISDATNALALEAATRRARQLSDPATRAGRVDLASSHRMLRAQKIEEAPGVRQHYRLFALCSAGRDTGELRFETEAARRHLKFLLRALRQYLGREVPLRVGLADLGEPPHRALLERDLVEPWGEDLPGVPLDWEDPTPEGRAYYRDLRFHIYARHSKKGEVQLGDAGSVDWAAKLLNNRKERMFISGVGSERLVQLFAPMASGAGQAQAPRTAHRRAGNSRVHPSPR